MKKYITILLSVILVLSLVACGSKSGEDTDQNKQAQEITSEESTTDTTAAVADESETTTEETSQEQTTEETQTGKDVLVVYFSATGTTKGVAEKIAAITDADLYEITAAQEYTSDDLDWNDSDSRTTKEQNDSSVRPEIGSDPVSLGGYSTIYIGYPIWWGEEPRIMDTFVESYNFEGITMIPFCTSASSGIGSSGKNLEDNAGSGKWLEGQRFGSGASEEDVRSWIEGLR